jgi:hypothetical protein
VRLYLCRLKIKDRHPKRTRDAAPLNALYPPDPTHRTRPNVKMSRFRQANAAYQQRTVAATPIVANQASDARASAAHVGAAPVPSAGLSALVQSALRAKEQALVQSIAKAQKGIDDFLAALCKTDARHVTNRGNDHIAGEDSTRLNALYTKMKADLRRLNQQRDGLLVKLGDRAPAEKMVKVWESHPLGGRWIRLRECDVERHQYWENLALADRAHQQLMDRRGGDANYRAQQQEVATIITSHEREEQERQHQLKHATYVIERRMVGMLASLHGIRCYHKRKNAQTGEWECDMCDCSKAAPGEFFVDAEAHPPGTFYLDESTVKRQVAMLRAAEEAAGAVGPSPNVCVSNPGGFGQAIDSRDHALLVHRAQTRVNQPGVKLPGDEAHTRMPAFEARDAVQYMQNPGHQVAGVVRSASFDLKLGGWVYDILLRNGGVCEQVPQARLSTMPANEMQSAPVAAAASASAASAVAAADPQPSSRETSVKPTKLGCPVGCDGKHATHTVSVGPGQGAKKYGFFLPASSGGRNFDGTPAFLWHQAPC